jgi:hypothetical protein
LKALKGDGESLFNFDDFAARFKTDANVSKLFSRALDKVAKTQVPEKLSLIFEDTALKSVSQRKRSLSFVMNFCIFSEVAWPYRKEALKLTLWESLAANQTGLELVARDKTL